MDVDAHLGREGRGGRRETNRKVKVEDVWFEWKPW